MTDHELERNVETDPDAGSVAGEAGDARPEDRGASGARGSESVPAAAVEELTRERDEYLDSLRRLKAEFDNFRKRTARERAAQAARAGEALVKELLPVLDDLERALVAAEEHEEAKLEDGVRLVHRALADVLARTGLAEIETDGAFDPARPRGAAGAARRGRGAGLGRPGPPEGLPSRRPRPAARQGRGSRMSVVVAG